MVRKIAICSQKGGVGKTTTSINLSAGLATMGYKVLLIDNDPQANATTSCGIRQQDIRLSLYDILTKSGQKAEPVVRKCNLDSLWIIPSSGSLASAEIELVKEMGRELILKEKMESIENSYDFIIIDCVPGVNLLVLNALFCCDEIIIPVQSQFLALEGIDQILHAVYVIQKRMRHPINITGIVSTMYDRRTKICAYILSELSKLFGNGLFSTVICVNTKLAEAPLKGMSIFEYDPACKDSSDYMKFAKEVAERGENNWREKYQIAEQVLAVRMNTKSHNLLISENQGFKDMIDKLKPLIEQVMHEGYLNIPNLDITDNQDETGSINKDDQKKKESAEIVPEEDFSPQEGKRENDNDVEEDILWN